jgi:LysM repeat protein
VSAKPLFVLLFFLLIIVVFASRAIGETDLTDGGQSQGVRGESTFSSEIDYNVFAGESSSSSSASTAGQNSAAQGRPAVNSPCGNSYTVKTGDTLSRIAQACAVSLQDLLAANASIKNPNVITVGQKIIIDKAAQAVNATATDTMEAAEMLLVAPAPTPIPGVKPGEAVTVAVQNFPPNAEVQVGIGEVGTNPEVIGIGTTDGNGVFKTSVNVPQKANAYEQWTVTITTVKQPHLKVTSEPFVIGE